MKKGNGICCEGNETQCIVAASSRLPDQVPIKRLSLTLNIAVLFFFPEEQL